MNLATGARALCIGQTDQREDVPMSTLTCALRPSVDCAPSGRAATVSAGGWSESPGAARAEWLTAGGPGLLAKRAVDVAGAIIGLVILAPAMVVIALLIRLDSRGPVFFRQVRRGHRGRSFRMLKFRTMAVDAEDRLAELENQNESAGGVLFKLRDDPRVTRLGWFLRRSSLDELPQLINVLRGEMSLVGPRPLQLRDSQRLAAVDPQGYARRLQTQPGLTGPWQVAGRCDLDYEQMVRLDLDYVANRSLHRDVAIIAETVRALLRGRGAY
jgi:lipopolysaccharide/colanic/teichoic acid biosynthesis glycosyltransferase